LQGTASGRGWSGGGQGRERPGRPCPCAARTLWQSPAERVQKKIAQFPPLSRHARAARGAGGCSGLCRKRVTFPAPPADG
jgi:hypothetical protein